MCGIAGIYNSTSDSAERYLRASAMAQAIIYRGPDAGGVYELDRTIFAHRRLAIIDLDSAADQPLISPDGRYMITFNGEIYNYRELRRSPQLAGYGFRTNRDTEVILALYITGGAEALDKLDGMFAFAICDSHNGKLILMRDRLGKKPLYYYKKNTGEVVFASTLAAMKNDPLWQGKLNNEALRDFLAYSYIPGNVSAYDGVFQVPPGSRMIFSTDGSSTVQTCWQLDYSHKNNLAFDEASAILRGKLSDAVTKRLIADVPCGVFLSGGVDSAVTAFLAAQQYTNGELALFTIGFAEEKYDERSTASRTADFIRQKTGAKIQHFTAQADCSSFDTLPELAEIYGEPFADFSMLPTYFLSRFAGEQVKCVLSGDGADEIFGGYERYMAMRYCRQLAQTFPAWLLQLFSAAANTLFPDVNKRSRLSRLSRFLRLAATPESRRYAALMLHGSAQLHCQLWGEKLQTPEMNNAERFINDVLQAVTTCEDDESFAECDLHTYMVNDILVKVDRASMAHGLEVRSPFLDKDVVEFAAALPFEYKQQGSLRKRILKQAMYDDLTSEVISGRKRGFAIPLAQWFRNEWRLPLEMHLLEGQAVKNNYLNRSTLEKLLSEHQKTRRDHSELLGNLLMLELFLKSQN